MRLTNIPQVYRHLNRWREILTVLSRYGLADWISRIDWNLPKEWLKAPDGEALARLHPEERVRLALTELGPTFVKFGQILSTRADLVGVALAAELQKLQDELPADPPDVVRRGLLEELGRPVEELFASFDDAPLASASIGQVHVARLRTGEEVVVKIRHHGIEPKIAADLEILAALAQLAEHLPEVQRYRPRPLVAEFRRTLLRELDLGRELRHLQQFARNFAGNPAVVIPLVYPQFSSPRVLTMQRLCGSRLTEWSASSSEDRPLVARRGAEIYLQMIFEHGFYHADPHPGNILVLPGNVVGLVDFGMVGRIDETLREDIDEALLALAHGDGLHLALVIMRVGATPPGLDQAGLSLDVTDFLAHYANQSLQDFDLSGALTEMLEIVRRYQITLPARVALLVKVLVMLEGTSRLVHPQFSLNELLVPYQKQVRWRRLSPARRLRKLWRMSSEMERLVESLPRSMTEILQQVQTGKFDIHLDHRGLEPSVNRLVLGLVTSALFVGSSALLGWHVPPVLDWPPILPNLSLPGAVGAAVSVGLGLRLLRAIRKSGRLDRQ